MRPALLRDATEDLVLQYTILGDELLEIPDALADRRFAGSPLVTGEPFIRYYAGYFRSPDGFKVGTFCVADHKPRKLFPDQRDLIRELAALVERELAMVDVIATQEQLLSTKNALLLSQQRLAQELADAADYVRQLLPAPLDGPVSTTWRFLPCAHLGGDALGYQWLDDDHFALFLLDVCGHGVGAALLSISVMNFLRGGGWGTVDQRRPESVLSALNGAFQMESHGDKFFTIWYGVYRRSTRMLTYASAGHPPGVLVTRADGVASTTALTTPGMIVGVMPDAAYDAASCRVAPGSSLYLFSDGVYEVSKSEGCMLPFDEFVQCLARTAGVTGCLDRTLDIVRGLSGGQAFEDDVSILEARFA